jgi:phosphoribosylformylglycinamidine (FGAM) synthase-like enzyme
LLIKLADQGLLQSATDLSDGLAVAVAQASFEREIGVSIDGVIGWPWPDDYFDMFFEESTGVLISCRPEHQDAIIAMAKENGLDCHPGGKTIPDRLQIEYDGRYEVDAPIAELKSAWSNALQSTLSIDTVTA